MGTVWLGRRKTVDGASLAQLREHVRHADMGLAFEIAACVVADDSLAEICKRFMNVTRPRSGLYEA